MGGDRFGVQGLGVEPPPSLLQTTRVWSFGLNPAATGLRTQGSKPLAEALLFRMLGPGPQETQGFRVSGLGFRV